MCGIFGWIPSKIYNSINMDSIARSLFNSLKERGPDDRGYVGFDEKGNLIADECHPPHSGVAVLLGQTRLSILDLSPAGHQPMFTEDRRYWIVYNGEIYNYKELRKELEQNGILFKTQTDTEVLLYSYATWKGQCLEKLIGMYAFVVYDSVENKIFCARDCFGIKPFFWAYGRNGFCFASEISALLQFPGVSKRVHSSSVYHFLTSAHVEKCEQTMVEGVYRLLPSHFMELDVTRLMEVSPQSLSRDIIRFHRYWKPYLSDATSISIDDAADKLRSLFLNSVKLHLRSDVPIGVALSGGIDSTAVACAVRHLEPDAEIHTFGYVADEPSISEEKWIHLAASGCNSFCHTTMPRAENLLQDLDRLILRQGEPFATTSIYAQFSTMRLAKEHGIKVLLEGQGADELFAGYPSYVISRAMSILENDGVENVFKFLESVMKWPGREKWVLQILQLLGIKTKRKESLRTEHLLNVQAFIERSSSTIVYTRNNIYKSKNLLRAKLINQLLHESVPGLMRHGDRNAMTFSLENRVPFLTRNIAEFAFTLPEEYLLSNDGCTKYILRKSLQGIVPDSILSRRDKIGFEAPGLPWLKELLPWVIQNLRKTESIFLSSGALLPVWKNIIRGAVGFDWFYWRVLVYCRWKTLMELEE